jgi:sulfur carrier protein ThiS
MKSENQNKSSLHRDEFRDKILKGLELTFRRLLEFKKQKNSPLVVVREGKIVKVKVEDYKY